MTSRKQMAVTNFVAKYVHAEMPVTGNPNVDRPENFQVATSVEADSNPDANEKNANVKYE
jgi:cytochrome c